MAEDVMPLKFSDLARATNSSGGDLGDAFQSFNRGLAQLGATRALLGANQQVQQIRDTEMDEGQKMQAFRNVAQNLTAHLIGFGMPVNAIDAMTRQIAPPEQQIQTPFEGLLSKDPRTQQISRQYIDDQAAQKKAEIEAENAAQANDPLRQLARQQKMQDMAHKDLMTVTNKANDFIASSRSLSGVLGRNVSKLQALDNALKADPNNVPIMLFTEAGKTLDTVFSGGTGTVSGAEELVPDSLQFKLKRLQGYGVGPSDKTIKVNAPDVVQDLLDVKDRLMQSDAAQQREGLRKTFRTQLNAGKLIPDELNAALGLVKNPDGTPETASVVGNKLRFSSDDKIDQLKEVVTEVMKNPDNPKAAQALSAVKENPYYLDALYRYPQFGKQIIGAYSRIKKASSK